MLDRCPHCRETPLPIESLELLNGYAGVTVHPDGTAQWGGETDVDWDSSTTQEYRCAVCTEPLPDAWQDELDRRLGNRRQKED